MGEGINGSTFAVTDGPFVLRPEDRRTALAGVFFGALGAADPRRSCNPPTASTFGVAWMSVVTIVAVAALCVCANGTDRVGGRGSEA